MQKQSDAKPHAHKSSNSQLVMGLVMFHLLLLPAVDFFPIWIGGQNALYLPWSRIAHGSLNIAQYELLVGFWAISRCDWAKRTLLFMTGLVVLSLLHVAIMFPLTKAHDSAVKLIWELLMNTMDVFVATYGPWHWLPSLCLTTFWICSTILVVRHFGFRLRKPAVIVVVRPWRIDGVS